MGRIVYGLTLRTRIQHDARSRSKPCAVCFQIVALLSAKDTRLGRRATRIFQFDPPSKKTWLAQNVFSPRKNGDKNYQVPPSGAPPFFFFLFFFFFFF